MKQYKADNQLIYEAYRGFGENSLYNELVDGVARYIRKHIGSSKAFGVLIWEGQRIDLKRTFSGLKNIAKEVLDILSIEENEEEIDVAGVMQLVQEYSGIYDANGRSYSLPGAYMFAIDDIVLAAFADVNVFDKWVEHETNALKASVEHSMVIQFNRMMNNVRSKFNAA